MSNARVATMDLVPDLFIEFCKASTQAHGWPRSFVVRENPLPDDAKVEAIQQINSCTVRLLISSASFAEVPEGAPPPELPMIVYQTVVEPPSAE